jgi:hypothetical protein
MSEPITDPLLASMFFARRVTLLAAAALVVLAVFGYFADRIFLLLPGVEYLLLMAVIVTLIVISAGSFFTWHYLFRVGLREAGTKYAVGHLLLCMAMTPVGLTGIILIPLLVYYDVERWRESADRASTA